MEILKGEKTAAQLAGELGVHPTSAFRLEEAFPGDGSADF